MKRWIHKQKKEAHKRATRHRRRTRRQDIRFYVMGAV